MSYNWRYFDSDYNQTYNDRLHDYLGGKHNIRKINTTKIMIHNKDTNNSNHNKQYHEQHIITSQQLLKKSKTGLKNIKDVDQFEMVISILVLVCI